MTEQRLQLQIVNEGNKKWIFSIQCAIVMDSCEYVATKEFADLIESGAFQVFDSNESKNNDEEEDMSVFVRFLGPMIKNLIKEGHYEIKEEFAVKKGVSFLIKMPCSDDYILHFYSADFAKSYIPGGKVTPSLVAELLTEITELKKEVTRLKNLSHNELISGLDAIKKFPTSPFRINFIESDIIKNGKIQKWVIDGYNKGFDKIFDKLTVPVIKELLMRSGFRTDSSSFSDTLLSDCPGYDLYNPIIRWRYNNFLYISNLDSLRIYLEPSLTSYIITGKLYIDGKSTYFNSEAVKKFVFDVDKYIIGTTANTQHLKTYPFAVKYSHYNGKSTASFIVIYQIEIKEQKIYLKRANMYDQVNGRIFTNDKQINIGVTAINCFPSNELHYFCICQKLQ